MIGISEWSIIIVSEEEILIDNDQDKILARPFDQVSLMIRRTGRGILTAKGKAMIN